jgi:hypothetical protein
VIKTVKKIEFKVKLREQNVERKQLTDAQKDKSRKMILAK